MSPEHGLVFNVLIAVIWSVSGGIAIWLSYWAYRRYLKQVDEGVSPDAVKGAMTSIMSNALLVAAMCVAMGMSIANIDRGHRWIAGALIICVAALNVSLLVRLTRLAKPRRS